jgi:hypothetical protein
MSTHTAPSKALPFELGESRSFRGLALVPLFPVAEPRLEYVGLDEAVSLGLTVSEIDEAGAVETLLLSNSAGSVALLYEGEELVGAKQNRVVERTMLVPAGATLKLPAKCVEQGRWARRTRHLSPAPRAAYPGLRRASRLGQAAVWASIAAKQDRLEVEAPTGASGELYVSRGATLDQYLETLPRLEGQAGALVGIAGRLVCLDYVSRPEVFAGLYRKLLRGYALDALEAPVDRPLPRRSIGRFLGELELAKRERRPGVGLGEEGLLTEYVVGSELCVDGELIALSAFPGR